MVPQHRPVHTVAFWWWRRREGGRGYLAPPQQLSNAEVPRGQGHGACDQAAVVTNTRRGRRTGGGGGVRLFGTAHALRPKCNAPTTAAEGGGGGAGTIHTNTCSGSGCVALPLAEAWHMVLAAPALGRALGHQQRCRTSPNPKSSAPTLGFAPTPHDNSDGPDPEPRSTNAGTCTARSCGAAQAY